MWNALLQLRKVSWYCVSSANFCPTHNSVRERRSEKYSGSPASARTSRKPASKDSLLEYWWLTGWPLYSRVGTEADHALDIPAASRPSRTAARIALAERMPVAGTCPV